MRRVIVLLGVLALATAPPAGGTLAYVKAGKAYVAADDGTGARAYGRAIDVELAPGGATLAVDDGRRVALVDVASAQRRALPFQGVSSFDWLDPDTLVVATLPARSAVVWLVAGDAATKIYTQRNRDCPPPCAVRVAGSPDGTTIAVFASLNPALTLIDRSGTRLFRLAPRRAAYQVDEAVWAPDSSSLALAELGTTTVEERLSVVSRNGARRVLVRSRRYGVDNPRWSPDAKQIAYTVYDWSDETMKFHRYDLARGRSFAQPGWVTPDHGLGAWIDERTWLAGYEGAIRAVDVLTGQARVRVRTRGDFDWQPTPAPGP